MGICACLCYQIVSSPDPTLCEGKGSGDFWLFAWLGWLWVHAGATQLCSETNIRSDWSVRLCGLFKFIYLDRSCNKYCNLIGPKQVLKIS